MDFLGECARPRYRPAPTRICSPEQKLVSPRPQSRLAVERGPLHDAHRLAMIHFCHLVESVAEACGVVPTVKGDAVARADCKECMGLAPADALDCILVRAKSVLYGSKFLCRADDDMSAGASCYVQACLVCKHGELVRCIVWSYLGKCQHSDF